MLKPCITCGEPTTETRCPNHRRDHPLSATRRGYDHQWRRLSERARRLQPFCTDCGTNQDLTADHSPEAWQRHEAGKAIRLRDVDVVCRSCNTRRGKARGGTPTNDDVRPRGKAEIRINLERDAS